MGRALSSLLELSVEKKKSRRIMFVSSAYLITKEAANELKEERKEQQKLIKELRL